jgi:precorrin-6A/cobalt-precorrin-6A reductase
MATFHNLGDENKMIGLILGTTEGKDILSLLNRFTDDIFVSTATAYGGSLLENYKYKIVNTKPLKEEDLLENFKKYNIDILIDASHPYAVEITENTMRVCEKLNIEYIRYERPSVLEDFQDYKNVITVENYEELYNPLSKIQGNILNTTGSNNIEKLLSLKLTNRIIHRILPSVKVMEKCFDLGVEVEDIIAIKGPFSKEFNKALIDEYNVTAMILKDSGIQGGTLEKLQCCIEENIYAIVIRRKTIDYKKVFYNKEDLIKYIERTFSPGV